MSPKEGAFWVGMISGLSAGGLLHMYAGLPRIVGLLGGAAVGFVLGNLLQSAYERSRASRRRPPVSQDDFDQTGATDGGSVSVTCSNAYCGWTGPARQAQYCPKCGEPLPRA